MKQFFVDLHVHIGRDSAGRKVKVAGARNLTFANIARECLSRKGIGVIGVVDCASPRVMNDIEGLLERGEMVELEEGGICYQEEVTVILGSEVETQEREGCSAHQLAFFPTVKDIKSFSQKLASYVKNINLSTQRSKLTAFEAFSLATECRGVFIPAHVFTPHKSLYGNCTDRLSHVFPEEALKHIPAVELGLSADTDLADRIRELAPFTFLSNSDAHSLPKIGREYNIVAMEAPTFKEIVAALRREGGRGVVANFGLDPKLGKYHRTYCPECDTIARGEPPVFSCPNCGNTRVVKGVLDRIVEIQDIDQPVHPPHRPPYHYQVPLEFVPGLGKKGIDKLISRFGSEMAILHKASLEEIAGLVGDGPARNIVLARDGLLPIEAGGGGQYGRALGES